MSREALHLPFRGPDALEAFAAMMLGERPFEPSEEARALAHLALEVARRPQRHPGRRSEGDPDAHRFRAVYTLARERVAASGARERVAASGARERVAASGAARIQPEPHETKPARSLRILLTLRNRQRAALALRYVLAMDAGRVRFVLAVSDRVAGEVTRAGLAQIARAAGSKMDVRRNLRASGALLASIRPAEEKAIPATLGGGRPDRPGGGAAGLVWRPEPRSVVRLLLAPPPPDVPEQVAGSERIVPGVRPVYGPATAPPPARLDEEPKASAPDRSGPPVRGPFRAMLAAAAAIVVLFAIAIVPRGAIVGRAPLAVVPIAPRIVAEAGPRAATPPRVVPAVARAFPAYRVRSGDTLWSIAARTLDDPYRWRDLWRANARKHMRDGSRFVDPNLIRPGWMLAIPRAQPRSGGG